jgi:hypothetical protein
MVTGQYLIDFDPLGMEIGALGGLFRHRVKAALVRAQGRTMDAAFNEACAGRLGRDQP